MSTLCKKCQVVQFNDADLNGTVETLPSGQSYFAPHLEGEELHHRVYLDYDLKDVLPDLPVVKKICLGSSNLLSRPILMVMMPDPEL